MRRWLLAAACGCLSCFGQGLETADERIKVGGKPNPFSIEQVEVYERSAGVGGGYGIKGRVQNQGKANLFNVVIAATIKRKEKPPIELDLRFDRVPGGDSSPFIEDLSGVQSTSEPTSISFEALAFLSEIEIGKLERQEQKQREMDAAALRGQLEAEALRLKKKLADSIVELAAICRAAKKKIENKTMAQLTVSEADLRDTCKERGLW